jgi:hypothetical protein
MKSIIAGLLLFLAIFVGAQTAPLPPTNLQVSTPEVLTNGTPTLSVTQFGAKGDEQQVFVNTTSNSTAVVFPFSLSSADINKTIELFGVGNQNIGNSSINGLLATNYQDYIGYITNINGNTAYITTPIGELPQQTSNNVYCIYGTNNSAVFQSIVDNAPTNAIIYIPKGNYLLIPYQNYTNYTYAYYNFGKDDFPLIITRGGLTFTGDGEGQTVLVGEGAFKNEGYTCMRAGIFCVLGPILTNNYPLIWQNLTFDGGLQQGYIGFEGIQPANWADGIGWDGWSCAGLDEGTEPTINQKEFVNCEFRHMRGEMIKGITGAALNETILVTNCYFWDGNATAFNYNYAHTITSCLFSNMYQIEEFYLKYPTNVGSYFVNNYSTNIFHNLISLNGGTLTNEPYVISNNFFGCNMDGNGIATCPASSVLIASNTFIEQPNSYTVAIVVGQAGAQPGDPNAYNQNITIVGNTFLNTFYHYIDVGGGWAGDVNNANCVKILNNVIITTGFVPLFDGGYLTNVVVSGNNAFGAKLAFNAGGNTPYPFVSTNNNYWYYVLQDGGDGVTPATNDIGYTMGSKIQLAYPVAPGTTNYLDDSNPKFIPTNAVFDFTNTTYIFQTGGKPVDVFLNGTNATGETLVVQPYQEAFAWWNGSSWQTNPP